MGIVTIVELNGLEGGGTGLVLLVMQRLGLFGKLCSVI